MIFGIGKHEYYFKYYSNQRVYDVTYNKHNSDLRNGFPCHIFEAMINYCLDTESYIINENGHITTCIFICDTDEIKQRFIIEMMCQNSMENLCEALLHQQI